MGCRLGWGWLPLWVVLLMTSCILITYVIAVLHGDVSALFPYISDTGASLPESAIFAQFLNMAACAAAGTLFIRYKIIHDLTRGEHPGINRLAAASLFLGLLSSFGLSLVGNFQDDKLPYVHFTGAFLVFILGGTYCYLDTAVTYKMASTYNSVYIGHIRLVISLIGTAGLLITGIAGGVASTQSSGSGSRLHWKPTEPGYSAHLASTFGEWIMAAAFVTYFFSHVCDFRKVEATFHVRVTVAHLSHPGPLSVDSEESLVSTARHDGKDEPDENTDLLAT